MLGRVTKGPPPLFVNPNLTFELLRRIDDIVDDMAAHRIFDQRKKLENGFEQSVQYAKRTREHIFGKGVAKKKKVDS